MILDWLHSTALPPILTFFCIVSTFQSSRRANTADLTARMRTWRPTPNWVLWPSKSLDCIAPKVLINSDSLKQYKSMEIHLLGWETKLERIFICKWECLFTPTTSAYFWMPWNFRWLKKNFKNFELAMPNFITWSPLRFAATPFLEILKTPPLVKPNFTYNFLLLLLWIEFRFYCKIQSKKCENCSVLLMLI